MPRSESHLHLSSVRVEVHALFLVTAHCVPNRPTPLLRWHLTQASWPGTGPGRLIAAQSIPPQRRCVMRVLLAFLASVVLLPGTILPYGNAQTANSGEITGVVTDSTGAVVPGARV